MGRAKPDPYKQQLSNPEVPEEYRVKPRDPEIYLSTSPWQIMTFEYEQRLKSLLIEKCFSDVGLLSIASPSHYIPLPRTDNNEYFYRNKMEYALYWDNKENFIKLAFHQRNSHRKIPFEKSSIERPEILAQAKEIVAELNEKGAQARDYQSLMLRCSQDGQVSGGLLPKYKSHPTFPPLTDHLLGIPYTYSVGGFFQINLPVYELALKEIAKHINTEKVLDLYAGVGTIGLSVARDKQLTLVEVNAAAYKELVKNCKSAIEAGQTFCDISSAAGRRFDNSSMCERVGSPACLVQSSEHTTNLLPKRHRASEHVAKGLVGSNRQIRPILAKSEEATDFIEHDTTVIVDPPRAGLSPKLVQVLNEVRPPKVIYLSCNPLTQARDISALAENYELTKIQPYNFFPRTPHIENLVILSRKT